MENVFSDLSMDFTNFNHIFNFQKHTFRLEQWLVKQKKNKSNGTMLWTIKKTIIDENVDRNRILLSNDIGRMLLEFLSK